jgi:hypothetical protein
VVGADATSAAPADAGGGPGLTDVYRRADGVATRVIADETLVVPFKGTLASLQQLFALNPVAAFVWRRLDGQAPLDAVLADVLGSFDVGRERAWPDLQELVAGLRGAGLLQQVTGETAAPRGA